MITHDQFPSFLYWCEFIQKIFGHYRRLHMNITQKNQRSLNKRSLCLNVWVNDSFDRQHFNQCNVWQNMIIVWIVFFFDYDKSLDLERSQRLWRWSCWADWHDEHADLNQACPHKNWKNQTQRWHQMYDWMFFVSDLLCFGLWTLSCRKIQRKM